MSNAFMAGERLIATDPPPRPGVGHRAGEAAPPAGRGPGLGDLFGKSLPMQQLFNMIEKVAPTRANVLISGESGTGKELVAVTLHAKSGLPPEQFVAVNCGAIPPTLIEAELFGHERGAFTGALRRRRGCFERADGGTLFLDEITEMPKEMQVKLLRVLETGRFCRVGGEEEIATSARVIAATNRCPQQAVSDGSLRADLWYRLSVFPLDVPSLRARGEDVLALAELFLARLNQEAGTQRVLSARSRDFATRYAWPGNVRELKNVVQRAFILATEELDMESAIGPPLNEAGAESGPMVQVPLGSPLAEAERRLIFATLEYCGGNRTRTAEVLGVCLKTLYNRLSEYHAEDEDRARAMRAT